MEGGCVLWIYGNEPQGPSSNQDEESLFLTPFFTNKMGFPESAVAKESACNAGDPGSIPESGRSAGEGRGYPLQYWASLVAQMVKRLPAMRETWIQSLGLEDPLEKELATHSTILAWKIPWMEEPGRLRSTGS